jgi:hypothetical protein
MGGERTRNGDNWDDVKLPAYHTERRPASPATAQHRVAVHSDYRTLHEIQGEDDANCQSSGRFCARGEGAYQGFLCTIGPIFGMKYDICLSERCLSAIIPRITVRIDVHS